MKPNIVFLDEFSLGTNDLTPIKELGNYTSYYFTTPEQVIERSKDADIIIADENINVVRTIKKGRTIYEA